MQRNATMARIRPAQNPDLGGTHEVPVENLSECYTRVRQATLELSAGLSPEDCALQSMPDASPVKWHLAHTSWFFETFVLEQIVPGYQHFHPQFRVLFNSYYVGVGERHPRPERGFLSRPGLEEIVHYRAHVDACVQRVMHDRDALPPQLRDLIELGLHHEQHFEADAYARWAGARLPSETEWEVAAVQAAAEGNFVEDGDLRPLPAHASAAPALQQMFGDVWEWTHSVYAPYPGYRVAPGAVGEYNGKFMVNQYVLRGGSFATPRSHIRASYRNFFPTAARWQFSGIRLARDIAAV